MTRAILHAKGSDAAIQLFLSEVAVAHSAMLLPAIKGTKIPMTARAARADLADIFGKDINRDVLNRLRHKNLITNGPRAPRPGAPHTFVTTQEFLARFDLQSLRDLPELDGE